MKTRPNYFLVILTGLMLALMYPGPANKALASEGQVYPDIVSVRGESIFENTVLAVNELGGMQRFVRPGQKVGILVNSDFREAGAYTHPDVTLAVLQMVWDAGAADVVFLQAIRPEYWERTPLFESMGAVVEKSRQISRNQFPVTFNEEDFLIYHPNPEVMPLDSLEVVKAFFDLDVFINLPIAKHHSLTVLTNAMKNLMGLNTRTSNVRFHLDGPSRNDPDFLARCIAGQNMIRKTDLIVSDVSRVIVTNGPGGPGDMVEPMRVVAGTDPVAVDAWCAGLIGFFADEVPSIDRGYRIGLGEKDLSRLHILELEAPVINQPDDSSQGMIQQLFQQDGWLPADGFRHFEGDDLFFLINGGADLYMEYGFDNVAAAGFRHKEKGEIYVELYRMHSDTAAFGVFSLRRARTEASWEAPAWLAVSDDNMHFAAGPWYGWVSYSAVDKTGRQALKKGLVERLAQNLISSEETNKGLPALFSLLPSAELSSARYLMGPLALNNVYPFGNRTPFALSQAVVITGGKAEKLIFDYSCAPSAAEVFDRLSHHFSESPSFGAFERTDAGQFSLKDRRDRSLQFELRQQHILVEISR